jgi:hypothetical protein
VLNIIRDKDALWVRLGGEKAVMGDSYSIVGEPVNPGSKQRDKFATGVVLELNGSMARVALDEGDVALPPKIFAAKDSGARRTEKEMREQDREREKKNEQRKKSVVVAANPGTKPAAETKPPETHQPAPPPAPEVKADPPKQDPPKETVVAQPPPPQPPPQQPKAEVRVASNPPPNKTVAVVVNNPGPPPPTPAPAVPPRKLEGLINPLEGGDVMLKSKTSFPWTNCELRIPPNRLYRFPSSYTMVPGSTVRIAAKHIQNDTRPPEATVIKGAWALARCTEGVNFIAYDRQE